MRSFAYPLFFHLEELTRRRLIVQFHTQLVSILDLKLFQSGGTRGLRYCIGYRCKERIRRNQGQKRQSKSGVENGVTNARREAMAYPELTKSFLSGNNAARRFTWRERGGGREKKRRREKTKRRIKVYDLHDIDEADLPVILGFSIRWKLDRRTSRKFVYCDEKT